MADVFSLGGQRVLITGGTRGIGRAIATRFAAAGAIVIANYIRNDAAAESLVADAAASGHRIDLCRADVTSSKGVERLLEVIDAGGPLSVFVHSAATGVHRSVSDLTVRHLDWTFALNVRAFFDLVVRLLPRFTPNASILAISSEGAQRAIPYYSAVGASKGALEALVRHLAAELAPRGIRVNAVAPGTVETEAWNVIPDADVRLGNAARRSPLGRLVTADEIARAAQFLCSPAAAGIVGHTLVVDGGTAIVG